MDQDRVTRTTLPQVTVGIPLSLLKRVDEQVEETGAKSRSAWILSAIKDKLNGEQDDEMVLAS